MPKSRFDRNSLYQNLLRKVIIRIDFEGLTNLDSLISKLKDEKKVSCFDSYRKVLNRNVSVSYYVDSNSAAVEEETNEPVHIFRDYNISEDEVELAFSLKSMSLTIQCKGYKTIDPYKNLIERLIGVLLAADSFIIVKRIGIRKISGIENEDPRKVFEVFEESAFTSVGAFCETEDACISYGDYTNKFTSKKYDIPVLLTYKRMTRHLSYPGRALKLQAILDIDGYIPENILKIHDCQKDATRLSDLMTNINEVMFSLFRNSVTIKYLECHGKI